MILVAAKVLYQEVMENYLRSGRSYGKSKPKEWPPGQACNFIAPPISFGLKLTPVRSCGGKIPSPNLPLVSEGLKGRTIEIGNFQTLIKLRNLVI